MNIEKKTKLQCQTPNCW